MSKRRTTIPKNTPLAHIKRGVGSVVLRRFDPSRDLYEQLTTMLHRAFARLAMMGMNCTCVDQDVAVTQRRAQAGAIKPGGQWRKVIGTMTLYTSDGESASVIIIAVT